MFDLPGPLGTLTNLLAVIVGFGGIIFIHELGHFVAAKWAGIRVLAFSMGMGPVVCSYRKGMGFRKGSTEPEYRDLIVRGADKGISSTEYRFSALPLGGYVKMLGQEDINPGAVSDAPDSYQNRPVWKRMVVISAGVVMNLILAAVLFVVVFTVGLLVPTPVVGFVNPDSPAAVAVATDRDDLPPGLLPEDRILKIDGREMNAFNEITTEVAMSGGRPIAMLIDRPGVGQVVFEATADRDDSTGFLDLGIGPASSPVMLLDPDASVRPVLGQYARKTGLGGFVPGSELVEVDGSPVARPESLEARADRGTPFDAVFQDPDGSRRTVRVTPERAVQTGAASVAGERTMIRHVLGLRGLLRVDPAAAPDQVAQGLEPGDVFARIGDVEFPAYADAIALIRSLHGQAVEIEVRRPDASDGWADVTMTVEVSHEGRIGFAPDTTMGDSAFAARPVRVAPIEAGDAEKKPPAVETPAAALIDRPGTRIVSIAGEPIASLRDIPGVLAERTNADFEQGAESFDVEVVLELPLPGNEAGERPTETRVWTLARADIEAVRGLGWQMPGGSDYAYLFEPDMVIDRASGPIAAVGRGIDKSRQTMMQTYLTFLRLFQGTVKIEHLKGPVGIAHIGTQVADQGFIWLLFFLGLVSINLAVINFLPLPIVDGGQFLMLAYEGIRRKPVPVVFQNVVTLAGLVLIGAVFLIVTFHDIKALLGL